MLFLADSEVHADVDGSDNRLDSCRTKSSSAGSDSPADSGDFRRVAMLLTAFLLVEMYS